MDRVDYREALFRRWWVLLVLGLVGALAGSVAPVHHAKVGDESWTTTTLVGAAPPTQGASHAFTSGLGTAQIIFYAQKAAVIEAAAQAVGLHESESKLEKAITITGPTAKGGQPGVVELSTTASTPAKSAAFTNAYANQLGNYLIDLAKSSQQSQLQPLQQQITNLEARIRTQVGKVPASLTAQLNAAIAQESQLEAPPSTGYNILQPAQAGDATRVGGAASKITSSHALLGLIGLVVGLLLAAGLVVLTEMFDRSLRTAARAEEAFGYRVVAKIPVSSREGLQADLSQMSSASGLPPGSPVAARAEAYQKLRMAVLLERLPTFARGGWGSPAADPTAPAPGPRKVVLVVSGTGEPTRSEVVDNLAVACADAGQRTLVVSTAGLHSEGVRQAGISGDITPSVLAAHVTRSRFENVALVSLLPLLGNSGQLLTRAPAVLDAARQLADVVIVNAPPMLIFHDAEALASVSDVVVVVGECGSTKIDDARRSGELLHRIDAPVIGVALTSVPHRASDGQRNQYLTGGGRSQLEPDRESMLATAGQ